MARRGRFGRSNSGTTNLSSFIRSLAQQNLNMQQSALFQAFYDGTPYDGKVPTLSDLQEFTDARIAESDGSAANISYYQNLMSNAQKYQVGKTWDSLKKEYDATGGANFTAVVAFLQGEGSKDYGSNLPSYVNNYVDQISNDLKMGNISVDQYNSLSQNALSVVAGDPNNYGDARFNVMMGLYEYEATIFEDKTKTANAKGLGATIGVNKELLVWYKGWLGKLQAEGINSGVFYSNINSAISVTQSTIVAQEKQAAAKAAAAFLESRKVAYESSKAIIDGFAREIASSIGVDVTSGTFGLSDLMKQNPAALTAWLETQPAGTKAQVEAAMANYAHAGDAYVGALNSQGKGATSTALNVDYATTQAKKISGGGTNYDEYVVGSKQKVLLMGQAGGVPGNEKQVMEQWVKFLGGESTAMFGDGLVRNTDPSLSDIQTKIDNEHDLYAAALRGEKIGQIPVTLMDEVLPALQGQGFAAFGTPTGSDGKALTGDNKYTAAEFSNAYDTQLFDQGLRDGTMQVVHTGDPKNPIEFRSSISAAAGAGVIAVIEQDYNGNNYSAVYSGGIPIYGSKMGQPDTSKDALWGYKVVTANGTLWASKDGVIYKTPPINISKLIEAADGKSIISRDSLADTTQTGTPYLKISTAAGGGVEATIDDLVVPGALQKASATPVNPYARVSESDAGLLNARGTAVGLQGIIDTVSPTSQVGTTGLAALQTVNDAIGKVSAQASLSQDSGVRVASMQADQAAQKAAAAAAPENRPAVLRPTPAAAGSRTATTPYASAPGTGTYAPYSSASSGGGLDLSFVFRALGSLTDPVGIAKGIAGNVGQLFSPSYGGINVPSIPQPAVDLGKPSGTYGAKTVVPSAPVKIVGSAGFGAVISSTTTSTTVPPVIINSGPRQGQAAGGGL